MPTLVSRSHSGIPCWRTRYSDGNWTVYEECGSESGSESGGEWHWSDSEPICRSHVSTLYTADRVQTVHSLSTNQRRFSSSGKHFTIIRTLVLPFTANSFTTEFANLKVRSSIRPNLWSRFLPKYVGFVCPTKTSPLLISSRSLHLRTFAALSLCETNFRPIAPLSHKPGHLVPL